MKIIQFVSFLWGMYILGIQGIIFDLDGTLVDTLDDLTDSMNAALSQVGRPARTPGECRQMIGHGLRRFAELALGTGCLELTDALIERMVSHYRSHCLRKTTAYPGMQETVNRLAAQGIRLAVLTNKNQPPAEIITRHYFGDVFNPVVGAMDGRTPKPDPQSTLEIMDGWGLNKEAVLFVGDSETDIRTAENAGIRCLACEWGFRSKDQLLQAGAVSLISHPRRILDIL